MSKRILVSGGRDTLIAIPRYQIAQIGMGPDVAVAKAWFLAWNLPASGEFLSVTLSAPEAP